ncbi:MAG TPA: monooxygenase [Candidatus Nanoarchaeia archaeon]|nr:monooxygenase [Candidatus Nanoarchaeia archaeon]
MHTERNHVKLLQIDFPYGGPWGEEMATICSGLAEVIARTPGLVWKIWTECREDALAGGIYLFTDEQSATNYLREHTARLNSFGVRDIRARLFDVNSALNNVTRATFCSSQSARSAS